MLRQDCEWALGKENREEHVAGYTPASLSSGHPLHFPAFYFSAHLLLQKGVSTHGRNGVLGPALLFLMLFILPYSPPVFIGPTAPHSTATSSTLVSVSDSYGTGGNGQV